MMLALKKAKLYLFFLFIIPPFTFCQDDNLIKEPSLVDIENAVMHIVQKVKNCVVSIELSDDDDDTTPFKHSGVIFDDKGHIITIASSVQDAKNVRVKTYTGEVLSCKVVGIDEVTNLAVIKINDDQNFQVESLPHVSKGDSSKLQIGSFLISIGNPYGLKNSASLGIVSGLERVVQFDQKLLLGLIQTTATINPGDAGGLTVDSRGQFVGIICSTLRNIQPMGNAIVAPQGINFVMPSNTVYWVANNLINHGKVNRGRMGITVKNNDEQHGVVIVQVADDSPAHTLGLQEGDLLLKLNGQPIKDAQELVHLIYHMLAGETINFEVWIKKDKKTKNLEITLETNS